jgi:hypothetical protein
MRILRAIGLLVLVILYFGGTFAQVSGAAFPITGSGQKTVNDFGGKTKTPAVPTISLRRHMPMIKLVNFSLPWPVESVGFGRPGQFAFLTAFSSTPRLLSPPANDCGTRAPPAF